MNTKQVIIAAILLLSLGIVAIYKCGPRDEYEYYYYSPTLDSVIINQYKHGEPHELTFVNGKRYNFVVSKMSDADSLRQIYPDLELVAKRAHGSARILELDPVK